MKNLDKINNMAYAITRTVGASHIGPDRKIRCSALVDFMQDCSGLQLDSLVNMQAYFKQNNVGMYLTSRQLDIARLPVYGEDVTVTTAVFDCKTIYGYRNTNIWGKDGDLCVASCVTGAFIDLGTGRPHRMPESVIADFQMKPKFDMEYLPRRIALPKVPEEYLGEIKVTRYLLDVNNHVNNARYVDLALEYLPPKRLSRIRLEYRTPALLGDIISVFAYNTNESVVIDLRGEQNSYAIVEIQNKGE